MIALVLRRQRGAIATVASVVGLCAAWIVALASASWQTSGLAQLPVAFMPLLIGLITGTTLFARELDHGEHLFTLTQSVRRTAWWSSAIAAAGVLTALAAGALSLVSSLIGHRPRPALLDPVWFGTSGSVVIAYALLAFAVTATVGLLTRSTLAAVVTATVVHFMVLFVLFRLRDSYLPLEAVTTPAGALDFSTVPDGAFPVTHEYINGAGRPIGDAEIDRVCTDGLDADCARRTDVIATRTWYQTPSHYWPLQLIETSILLTLSVIVVATGRIGLRQATRP
ncbi:hypothetical protein [Pseudonocardia sp. ICBG162]|uniref:hypothetical protein n=1 Tax=Pseudonocardia sp. ICBG162 TaxID=2846761 RepID=UPI001CF70037|nr:hypothetical protein [Pseudonocardia sp. ICBG162]